MKNTAGVLGVLGVLLRWQQRHTEILHELDAEAAAERGAQCSGLADYTHEWPLLPDGPPSLTRDHRVAMDARTVYMAPT